MKFLVFGLLSLFGFTGNAAADTHQFDALNWLKKIEAASHQLTYTGTFVYQHGVHVETSRITHFQDEAGEHERLEMLDGPARETIRLNDDVYCYLPKSKTVKVEKLNTRKFFPALLPKDLDRLADGYTLKLGDVERVAGYECRVVLLEPRDELRYSYKLCGDLTSALLLKAIMVNKKNDVLNQFAFTHITMDGKIDKSRFNPQFMWSQHTWQKDKSIALDGNANVTGWTIKQLPPGFVKTREIKRAMPGKAYPVTHLVYSDGLATVSVFIEPLAGMAHSMQGLSSQEQVNIYTKPLNDNQITVIGEVPVASVMQFANSVVSSGQ